MNANSNPGSGTGSDRGKPAAAAMVRQLLPLTVWLCSDHNTAATATDKGGKPQPQQICRPHQQAVGRELARHLIEACTVEKDVVAEAFTSSASTLAAAARAGRRAVGCVPHFPLAQHIAHQLRTTLTAEQAERVALRRCRADQMETGTADHLGKAALVIAALPAYETGGRAIKPLTSRECPACRADFWMLSQQQLGRFLAGASRLLRPGGHLAVITTTRHEDGRLIDPAPEIIRRARLVGFRYTQHVIAVRVPVEGDALVVQTDRHELAQLRDIRSRALPPAAKVHADVLLFTRPVGSAGKAEQR